MTRQHSTARLFALLAAFGVSASACHEEVEVGTQCPSPYSGMATVEEGPDAGRASFYGTSCAPCDPDEELRLDEDGCPVYVTFASCGGDVCLFGLRVKGLAGDAGPDAAGGDAGSDDAGIEPADDDASVTDDGGNEPGSGEDGG